MTNERWMSHSSTSIGGLALVLQGDEQMTGQFGVMGEWNYREVLNLDGAEVIGVIESTDLTGY